MHTTRTSLLTVLLMSAACQTLSDAPGQSFRETVTVTALDTRSLAPGASLELELDGVTIYEFDPSLGPIAFERIVLLGEDGYVTSDVVVEGMADARGLSTEEFTAAAFEIYDVGASTSTDFRRARVCEVIFCGPGGGGVDLDCNAFPMICFDCGSDICA